jgi:hypothetical protein
MRPSVRFLFVGLLGLAIGAWLLYWLIQSFARDSHGLATVQAQRVQGALGERSEAEQQEISTIKTDIGRLQYQLSLLRQQLSSNEQKKQDPETEKDSDDAIAKDPSERTKQAQKERMEGFEYSFRAEPQDSRWSPGTLAAVHEAMEKDTALRAAILHLDCRSSLCRLELSDDGTDSLSGSIVSLAQKLMKVFPNIMGDRVDAGGGKSTLVYYMLRTPYSPDSVRQ